MSNLAVVIEASKELSTFALLVGPDHFVVHFLERELCPLLGLCLLLFAQHHCVRLDQIARLLLLLPFAFASLVEVGPALFGMLERLEGVDVAEIVRLVLLLPVGRQ